MSSFNYRTLLDISKCLSHNYPVFNPSVVNLYSSIYLVSYRFYSKNEETAIENHPWSGEKWKSIIDETHFALINIDLNNNKYNLIKRLNTHKVDYAVDARLFVIDDIKEMDKKNLLIKIALVYNRQIFKPNIKPENSIKYLIGSTNTIECSAEKQCTSIVMQYIDVIVARDLSPEKIIVNLKKESFVLCSNLSYRTEKNWGLFIDENQIKIIYSFTHSPNINKNKDTDFIIINTKSLLNFDALNIYKNASLNSKKENFYNKDYYSLINPEQYLHFIEPYSLPQYTNCTISPSLEKQKLFNFSEIETLLRGNFNDNKSFAISSSTPAILFDSSNKEEWLSVGHVKFKKDKIKHTKNVENFLNKLKQLEENSKNNNFIMHYDMLIYMMFFFKFKKEGSSYIVNGVGPMFIIYEGEYILNFPSGLCNTNNERYKLLSYGDGDLYSKILVIDKKKLQFNNNLKNPEEWKLILINTQGDNDYSKLKKDFTC